MGQVIARKLRKEFAEVVAVDGVDLEIRDREFVVFLGPSGCGKTTMLRMIAGLEKPTSGDIIIGERVVNDLPPRTRGIAMVFQGYGLYPHLKVRDNIAFPLRTQRTPTVTIEKKVAWAAGPALVPRRATDTIARTRIAAPSRSTGARPRRGTGPEAR